MDVNAKVHGMREVTELFLKHLPAAAAKRPMLRASHIAVEGTVGELRTAYLSHNKSGSLAHATRSWTARKRMSMKGGSETFSSVQVGPKRSNFEAIAMYQQFYARPLTPRTFKYGLRHAHLVEWGTKHSRPFRHMSRIAQSRFNEIITTFEREMAAGMRRAISKARARGGSP